MSQLFVVYGQIPSMIEPTPSQQYGTQQNVPQHLAFTHNAHDPTYEPHALGNSQESSLFGDELNPLKQ